MGGSQTGTLETGTLSFSAKRETHIFQRIGSSPVFARGVQPISSLPLPGWRRSRDLSRILKVLAWPPLQSPAVKKKFFFVQILGGEKLLKFGETWAVKIFSRPERGKHFSIAFRIVFRVLFRVFQTVFRVKLKHFRGQFRSAGVPP